MASVATIVIFYLQAVDPYGTRLIIADVGGLAPAWVRVFHVVDVVLLGVVVYGVFYARRWAYLVLFVETIYVLVANIGFVTVSGLDRFTVGFASDEYLTLFLGQIAGRVLILGYLARDRLARLDERPLQESAVNG